MFHVIDDMKFVSEVISEIIRKLGYDALEFNSAEDYIAYTESPDYINPKAVFTDIIMPSVNGYEMIDTVSRRRPDLTFVIMFESAAVRQNRRACRHMHLAKPFRFDDIREVIDALPSA